jgi:hypothetical protein
MPDPETLILRATVIDGQRCAADFEECRLVPRLTAYCRARVNLFAPVRFAPTEAALLHFIGLFVPAFWALIDDHVVPATHRGSDRLDCHDPGRIAVRAILKPYGLRPVRQPGHRNFTHDKPLVLMREREISQWSVDTEIKEYPLWGVPALTCIKIKTGPSPPVHARRVFTARVDAGPR